MTFILQCVGFRNAYVIGVSKCGVYKDSSCTFGVPNFTRISGDGTYPPTCFVNTYANSALFKIDTSMKIGTAAMSHQYYS